MKTSLEIAVRRLFQSGEVDTSTDAAKAVLAVLGRPRCVRCCGTGEYTYGSTSTWRRGIGGCAMTKGTCDRCWGSGDESAPGENLREKMWAKS